MQLGRLRDRLTPAQYARRQARRGIRQVAEGRAPAANRWERTVTLPRSARESALATKVHGLMQAREADLEQRGFKGRRLRALLSRFHQFLREAERASTIERCTFTVRPSTANPHPAPCQGRLKQQGHVKVCQTCGRQTGVSAVFTQPA